MEIKTIKKFEKEDIYELFSSVNWNSANNPEKLLAAFSNSTNVISAWEGKKLIGIIRSMDDGCWSANIDCLVVHKCYQKKGIATMLLSELLKVLKDLDYINVCPDDKELEAFYKKFGFKTIEGYYLQKTNF